MRIAHITYAFGLGGIETMLRNIANEQTGAGHEVHVIVINNSVNGELFNSLDRRIVFRCIGRRPGSKNPLPYIRLNILLRSIGADVIHLHYSSIARFVWLPSLKHRLCETQHDVCNEQNSHYLYKCRRIYAISNVVQTDIAKWTGLKSEVVLNGVDVDSISHANGGRKPNVFRIVQVSRLMHEKKGQHILINAVCQLVKRGYSEIHLDLIGDGESCEYLENTCRNWVCAIMLVFSVQKTNHIFTLICANTTSTCSLLFTRVSALPSPRQWRQRCLCLYRKTKDH